MAHTEPCSINKGETINSQSSVITEGVVKLTLLCKHASYVISYLSLGSCNVNCIHSIKIFNLYMEKGRRIISLATSLDI